MFRLPSSARLNIGREIPDIRRDFEVLHYDQRPILFTGLNRFDDRIVGSAVDVDENRDILRFFYVQTVPGDYGAFLRRSVTYLDLITRSDLLYVVDRSLHGNGETVYLVRPAQVPDAFLPGPRSFCPPQLHKLATFEYVSTLKGPIADRYRAQPEPLAALITSIPRLLHDPFADLLGDEESHLAVSEEVLPFAGGSFKVHFSVNLREPDLFTAPGKKELFVRQYLDYCMNHFPAEARKIADGLVDDIPEFRKLMDAKSAAMGGLLATPDKDDTDIDASLLKRVEHSAEQIGEMSGYIDGNLSSVTLANVLPTAPAGHSVVGIIDQMSGFAHRQALEQYQGIKHKLVESKKDREYTIEVYRFNNHSGIGAAAVFSDAGMIRSVPITFVGEGEPTRKLLTKSLHENIRVTVRALAVKRPDESLARLKVLDRD